MKTILNNYDVNVEDEVSNILTKLTDSEKEKLVKIYIRNEVVKKRDEIRKNYKDVTKFVTNFSQAVYERLLKKLITI